MVKNCNIEVESLAQELLTLRDCVRWAVSQFNAHGLFFGHGTNNSLDEAVNLVLFALHLPADIPEDLWASRLTLQERCVIFNLLKQRIEKRLPLNYLTHQAWFAGLEFYVDERVLIPRSPISELIENGFEPWLATENILRVLELGTGSGCIAIATALHLPNVVVDAVDISEQALSVARQNVEKYDLTEHVNLLKGDLFSPLKDTTYNLVISNPPYVDAQALANMPDEFHHEPLLGLAAGDDGLDIVRRILREASDFLSDDGVLIIEVGASQMALTEAYPLVPFLWLEFVNGGEGVFLLTAEQLKEHEF